MKRAFIALIRLYQKHLSPHLGDNCRFAPTCSQYAIEALEEWGLLAGGVLALYRVLRCNPLNKHWGYDPVPKRKNKNG